MYSLIVLFIFAFSDSYFGIVLNVRACTRWLNIMEQLVQSEDVQFMLGMVFGYENMPVSDVKMINQTKAINNGVSICDAVTSLGSMTSIF